MINNLFKENSISFNKGTINIPFESINPDKIKDFKFGILNLKAEQAFLNENIVYEFIFSIDSSGSMNDKCSDGKSKMEHIIHTITNMINYFKENLLLKIYITINSFDSIIKNIVERTFIQKENVSSILNKINAIKPKDSTNIELALKKVKNSIKQLKYINPNHNFNHILMTDGEITLGNANHNYLSSLVDRSISNIFVGFGLEHDSVLLNYLSEGDKSSYYFIDNMENSGWIYGEIIHGIIYKLLYDVKISIENGLIYDYKNNSWVNNLLPGEIVGESEKIFHIITSSSSYVDCNIDLYAKKTNDNCYIYEKTLLYKVDRDLTKYIYRQKTLELLFIVKDFLKRRSEINVTNEEYLFGFINESENLNSIFKEEEKMLREKLSDFLNELKIYMNNNNLNEDKFMKNLCDDIYITGRTFSTRYGGMYISARQTNQGTQRGNSVGLSFDNESNLNIPTLNIPYFKKKNNINNNDNFNIDTNVKSNDCFALLYHDVANYSDSPYLTPGSTRLMREMSVKDNIFEHSLEEEETQVL